MTKLPKVSIHTASVETLKIFISDWGFITYSNDYYQAERQLKKSRRYNRVNYFLLCKSIELSLKAYLLYRGITPNDLRTKNLGHNLISLINKTGTLINLKINEVEKENIEKANRLYCSLPAGNKSLEYFNPKIIVAERKSTIPDLVILRRTAKKLISQLKPIITHGKRVSNNNLV